MKSEEFLIEAKEYVNRMSNEFSAYKDTLLDIMSVFNKICEQNNIPYYIFFGTLLGWVRDKGMIPWDADIDVAVPIIYIDRLISALKDNLPNDYFVVSNYLNKDYPLCETRVCKHGCDTDNFHLDVFYLIGAPDDLRKANAFKEKIVKTYFNRLTRNEIIDRVKYSSTAVYIIKKAVQTVARVVPSYIVENKCQKMLFKYNFEEAKYFISWCYPTKIYPKEVLESPIKSKLCNVDCMVPSGYETILNILYKDYKSYLPIEDRFNEFYLAYRRFAGIKNNTFRNM